MRRLLIAACVIALASASLGPLAEGEYQYRFVDFAKTHSKVYDTKDIFRKFSTFKYWVDFVRNHNANPNNTWTAGINEFSDLTPQEFEKIYLSGLTVPADHQVGPDQVLHSGVANNIDWRNSGYVTGVKNQGSCGSCWAFAATGVMEGLHKKKTGSLPNLSEQQLVDCSGSFGNQGCNGGWPSWAMNYAGRSGSCSQTSYPYTGRQGTCKACTVVSKLSGARTGSGENTLVNQLNQYPVSVALDASSGWQAYRSGVFTGPCSTQLNHAVLAVGYTSTYYIVKNSWGASWGNGGYIHMQRGKNLCGISNALAWAA